MLPDREKSQQLFVRNSVWEHQIRLKTKQTKKKHLVAGQGADEFRESAAVSAEATTKVQLAS